MKYTKVIHGFVEQVINDEGYCVEQRFVQLDSAPVERRMIRDETDVIGEDDFEDDELIEHPDDILSLESHEKFCPIDMIQPTITSSHPSK